MSVTIMRITCTRYTQCYNYYNYANTTLCYPPLTSLTSTLKPNPPSNRQEMATKEGSS